MTASICSPRLLVRSLAVIAVFLAANVRLLAEPIEALPYRTWTSRSGATLEARLIFYPRRLDVLSVVELLPIDIRQPVRRVAITDLSGPDAIYIRDLEQSPRRNEAYSTLRKTPLTYDGGTPVTGTFLGVSSLFHLVTFESDEKPPNYWLDLEDLSQPSRDAIHAAYLIPPRLETPLSQLAPLNIRRESPSRFALKDVPLLTQVGSYCVPTSAAMIAGYHGIRVDQRELAHLSSDDSRKHRGTYSSDMVNAMEGFGFLHETRLWSGLETDTDYARFERAILPFIRASLQEDGPLYVSFKPGVYGSSGHGCVITGYNDRGKGEIEISNPWGKRESFDYERFSRSGREVVRLHFPAEFAGDSALIEPRVLAALPRMPLDLTEARRLLSTAGLRVSLRLHGRRDRREDEFETQRWALAQGRRVIRAGLGKHALLLVPAAREGRIVGWYLLRKDPGDPLPLIRPLAPGGWREPARPHIDLVLKTWSTPVNVVGESSWDLPLLEIDQ